MSHELLVNVDAVPSDEPSVLVVPSASAEPHISASPIVDEQEQRAIFRLFVAAFFLTVLINFDSGALPACLVRIDEELGLSYTQQGALGGLVYVGLTIASLFAGPLLQKRTRLCLVVSMAINGVACLCFGLAPWPSTLLLARFAIGFTQAFFVIYAPVWVDEYAPKARQTVWMSLLQVANPLGVMLGYAAGIATSAAESPDIVKGWGKWRAPFFVQGLITLPLAAAIIAIPHRYLDTAARSEQRQRAEAHRRGSVSSLHSLPPDVQLTQLNVAAADGSGPLPVNADRRLFDASAIRSQPRGAQDDNEAAIDEFHDLSDEWREAEQLEEHEHRRMLSVPASDAVGGAAESKQDGPDVGTAPVDAGGDGQIDPAALAGWHSVDAEASDLNAPVVQMGRTFSFSNALLRMPRTKDLHPSLTPRSLAPAASFDGLSAPKLRRQDSLAIPTRHLSVRAQITLIWRRRVFVWTVFTLTALFFVVTGLQFWIGSYLVDEIGADIKAVGGAFVVVSATAPTLGVLWGGWLVDKRGGYQGKPQTVVTLRANLVLVAIAVVCCVVIAFARSFALIMTFTWFLLFFGGAIVPSCTGIMLCSIPLDAREFGSAVSQISYNLLGYALAPILSGIIMQWRHSLAAGFRVIVLWCVFGAVGMLLAYRAAVHKLAEYEARTRDGAGVPLSSSSAAAASANANGAAADPGMPSADSLAAPLQGDNDDDEERRLAQAVAGPDLR